MRWRDDTTVVVQAECSQTLRVDLPVRRHVARVLDVHHFATLFPDTTEPNCNADELRFTVGPIAVPRASTPRRFRPE